jgi:hypothetical protein
MNLKITLSTFCICFAPILLWAQSTIKNQAPWQQRVEYTINVKLDDVAHLLIGNETILYVNNSPDTLHEMYIHLWPNAYKNNETAFGKQNIENKKTEFYYLPNEDRGYIDSLNFLADWVSIKWELTEHIDIAKLTLRRPLLPGEKVRLATTFKVKLPKVISRMGHEDQLYCITQWYPKPAVYDVNGWNPMPYLDQGEFYSEFGAFKVNITVPKNYVVAATGQLQNQDEKQWLYEKSKEKFKGENQSKEFPVSSSETKTLTFIQDSIHDFGWFADKRFSIERSEVTLPKSGRKVTTWMYEVAPKKSSIQYVDTAILFYSAMLGEYPYSDVSVAVTPLVSGAGMEYPMITNITESGRQVIVHEVGHNWLYGILASNEREYPWMDESINNYYETRSAENDDLKTFKPLTLQTVASFGSDGYRGLETRYLLGARKNEDQACFLPSVNYTDFNYGAVIYGKASTAFHYLQRYLGDSSFDAMMQYYYEKWKFKHPLPNDFIHHAKQFTGKELDWFFEGLMATTVKQDWKIKKIQKSNDGYWVSIKNTSSINAPVSITGIKNDLAIQTIWVDSITEKPVLFPQGEYDVIRVDAFDNTTDIDRSNNTMRTKGLFKKCEPINFKLFGDAENDYANQLFYSPIIGANLYNKTMLGMAFYNGLLPVKKGTEYIIAPMYAFGTKDLAGTAEIQHHFLTYGFAKRVTLEVKAAQFANEILGPTTYTKLQGGFNLELTPKLMRTSPMNNVYGRMVLANERKRGDAVFTGDNFTYVDLGFSSEQKRVMNPYSYIINYQFGKVANISQNDFHKLTVEATQFVNYAKPKKGFTARFFGGVFLNDYTSTSGREDFRAGSNNGYYDYTYDQSQFGRSEEYSVTSNSLFAQQLIYGGVQFKELYPMVFTNKWATGLNLETTIPGIIPIVLYGDLALVNANDGYFDGNTNTYVSKYTPTFLYTSGISLVLFKDVFRVNIPVMASKAITDYFKGNTPGSLTGEQRYTERITFSLNLNKINPIKSVRKISF